MFSNNAEEVITGALLKLERKRRLSIFRGNTVELRAVTFRFDPSEEFLDYGNTRMANREYIKNELDWYLSHDLCIKGHKGIEDNKTWQSCATSDGMVNSNYGNLVFSTMNYSQFTNAVKSLKDNFETRQSVIIYNRPSMQYEHNDNMSAVRDFTCTMYTHHFIENDFRLNYYVYMRSNDAIFGLQNDYSWHYYVYHKMFDELKKVYPLLEIGQIIWHDGSLHVYEKHYDLLTKIIKEYRNGLQYNAIVSRQNI